MEDESTTVVNLEQLSDTEQERLLAQWHLNIPPEATIDNLYFENDGVYARLVAVYHLPKTKSRTHSATNRAAVRLSRSRC